MEYVSESGFCMDKLLRVPESPAPPRGVGRPPPCNVISLLWIGQRLSSLGAALSWGSQDRLRLRTAGSALQPPPPPPLSPPPLLLLLLLRFQQRMERWSPDSSAGPLAFSWSCGACRCYPALAGAFAWRAPSAACTWCWITFLRCRSRPQSCKFTQIPVQHFSLPSTETKHSAFNLDSWCDPCCIIGRGFSPFKQLNGSALLD